MVYAALPDQRMPYDVDGTVVGQGATGEVNGVQSYPSGSVMAGWQGINFGTAGGLGATSTNLVIWLFFVEQRVIAGYASAKSRNGNEGGADVWKGSNDSGNGLDGTWETASLPSGHSSVGLAFDWRAAIKPISFTGPKRTIRQVIAATSSGGSAVTNALLHVYGHKFAGQTPDDIIFIDHDTTPGAEFLAPEDFGDRPLGTTVVRQFRVKNTSASLTANTVLLQCNDTDFVISADGTTYGTSINIGSIAAGAESATMYCRNTTPAPGGLLGPRHARIVATVGSWT